MPTGTPYNSFVLPYRIKVDDFATPLSQDSSPALHLLTHTHSDHINGLSAKSFGYVVVCSHDAKEMLLRHEVYAERELRDLDMRAERTRTYAHLKVDPLCAPTLAYYQGPRDLLKAIHLHKPTIFELAENERVTITALDANHCPGAVMYLIEGYKGAILHTGDFRAEPWFLDSIIRNPFLQTYLHASANGPLHKVLDCIYLDTACVFSTLDVPTKTQAIDGLVDLMQFFPSDVYFYINSWTWGYEDVLKAIARTFQSKIHVDRYKNTIYQHISDPYMRLILTRDAASTRFHACERFNRCDHVRVDNEDNAYPNATSRLGKRVVYINPVTMGKTSWDSYFQDTKRQLLLGETTNNLLVPLSRHSTLPELKAFVSLFRPKSIVPNTLDPRLQGLDWLCIDRMFQDCLYTPKTGYSQELAFFEGLAIDEDEDLTIKNLVGGGSSDIVSRWADIGRIRNKLEAARNFLDPRENAIIDRLLGVPSKAGASTIIGKGKTNGYNYASDEDTDDEDADKGRGQTAHKLFASLAGIGENETPWWLSSPLSDRDEQENIEIYTKDPRPPKSLSSRDDRPAGTRPLTPISSPYCSAQRAAALPKMDSKRQSATSTPTHRPLRTAKQPSFYPNKDLLSPICLRSSSPLGTIFASPVSKSKSKEPKSHALKSPLAERKNIFSLETDRRSLSSTSVPIGIRPEAQSESFGFRVILPQALNQPLPVDDHQVVGPKSPEPNSDSQGPASEPSQHPHGHSPKRSRQMQNLQRIRIGEHLARSRPYAVAPSYVSKRERLMAKYTRQQVRGQYLGAMARMKETTGVTFAEGGETMLLCETEEDKGLDWERCRDLAETLRSAILNEQPYMLPTLKCTDSQSSEYAF